MNSLWLDATARINRGERMVLLFPWHQSPDEQPDLERIDEGYAADSVESWYPIDDHHWYFTRDDLGRLFQETTGILGDLSFRKTTELRRWLARALNEGEVRAYLWRQPEIPVSFAAQTETAKAGPEANAWHGLGAYEPEPKPQSKAKAWPANEPTSFAECEKRLIAAKARIEVDHFQPKYSDAELLAMRDEAMRNGGTLPNRFIVWVGKGAKGDGDLVGFKRADTVIPAHDEKPEEVKPGRATAWTAAFSQVEDADLDAELLCAKNGMEYDPKSAYTVVIIDRSIPVPGAAEGLTFIPTYEKMIEIGMIEFVPEGLEERDLRAAMTPECTRDYLKQFPAFFAFADAVGRKTFDPDMAREFGSKMEQPKRDRFLARQHYNNQFGANKDFLGNGLTKQLKLEKHPATIPKDFGSFEAITLERNPPTIGQRKAAGAAHSFTIPAIKAGA